MLPAFVRWGGCAGSLSSKVLGRELEVPGHCLLFTSKPLTGNAVGPILCVTARSEGELAFCLENPSQPPKQGCQIPRSFVSANVQAVKKSIQSIWFSDSTVRRGVQSSGLLDP